MTRGTRQVKSPSSTQKRGQRGTSRTPDPSPSLPMLRTSERGSLKKCEFLWNLEFNAKRKPHVPATALRFGTLWHKAMAGWYIPGVKRGTHPATGFRRAYKAEVEQLKVTFKVRDEDEVWHDALELGVEMANHYVEHFGQDDEWEVLVTEQPFRVLVYRNDPDSAAAAEPWFLYTGVLDGVWRNRGTKELWIPDHKSTAGIGGTTQHPKIPPHLQMDDQAGAYWSWGVDWLVQEALLKRDRRLNGMLYNYARKAIPDERPSKLIDGFRVFLNKDGSPSKVQPSPYFARFMILRDEYDREEAKRRARIDFRRTEMLRSGELELSKNPGMFTCPSCWARDICELHETGNDWHSMLLATTTPWDPYAEHEIYGGR